ncbi:hypothetical protein P3X46_005349 [Hevea brasiliensis]|uniref:Response regulatory domain-containing protein n=1 Tax=Hevea brasiliensis TaxID=3981 RepID=A0ABQ9N3E2_HEVBR|nr:two-component response regulator 24-like [Hevea brasiliensis]KAJ9185755.1 hypothetical protein P3X46_005349 [Hevea brasiliensis]
MSSSQNSTVTKEEMFDGNENHINNGNPFSVLVVDDDNVVRTIHKMMLEVKGMEVQLATNGKEAVDLHRVGACFNLILMDKDMPVMNGYQATKELRDMGVNCPIIGVTSSTEEAELEEFMEAGLDDCICKPLTIEKIACYLPGVASTSTANHRDDYDDYVEVEDENADRASSTNSNNN